MSKRNYISVDRIEETKIICISDENEAVCVCSAALPFNIREGLILFKTEKSYEPDYTETEKRRKQLSSELKKLLKQ